MGKRQYALVKGELLVWARRSLRMGPEEAAQRLNVPPERLLAWEQNAERLTISQLRELARIYRRPLAVFFLPRPPKDFHVPHDFRTVAGDPEYAFSPELLGEIRSAQYRRELAVELAEDEVAAPGFTPGSIQLARHPDAAAQEARALLDVPLEEQKQWKGVYEALNRWREALEHLGILVFHFEGVEVEEARGFSLGQLPYPIIGVNGKDSPAGRIFTLMHEFVHLLLGAPGISDLRESSVVRSSDQEIEVFCNRVAGAILVPEPDLLEHPVIRNANATTQWSDETLGGLVREYAVSREVILRRLLILGKTSQAFYDAKRTELRQLHRESAKGGFLSVPMRVIRDLGRPFLRIILGAYYRQAITSSDLSEFIGARWKHLPEIEERLLGRNMLTGGER